MTLQITRRRAVQADQNFAFGLYLQSTMPLLMALGTWDEARVTSHFVNIFKPEQTRIIQKGGKDIGWIQVSKSARGFHLHQLHLLEEFRDSGVGTFLVEELQRAARDGRCAVTLNVMRGNRALELYQRLGFSIAGEEVEKLHMIWWPEGLAA